MRRKEEREEELGIGRSDLDGHLQFRLLEGKMEFWAEKRALPYSQIRDDTRKIVTVMITWSSYIGYCSKCQQFFDKKL